MQQKIDFNGKTTTYAYDSNNRLQSKTPDPSFNAPAVAFTYSATGKRLTMSDVSGVTTYTYDPQTDRLTQKQTPEGTLNYTYDAAGNLKSLQSQNQGGASDAYTYDADNRLATVTDASGQTTYAYDNVGNLQSFAYPNGVTTAYTYDALNRLKQMGAGKNGTLQANYVYTLGAAGNRLSVAELSGRTVNYGYDSLYRLTSETVSADPHGNNGTGAYTYDNVGNRLTLNSSLPPAGMMNYTYDADDRLGSDQYDPNGNTTSSSGTTNVYDFENHMVQHGSQPGAVSIVYDGDGNRVSETVAGVTTQYLVDTQNPTGYAQVVDELQNGAVVRTYSWGLELISKLETGNSKLSFYGFDGHGSVRFLTDSSGAVTDTYDFDAFGNLINQTGSTPNNYLFAGEQYDPALGLYYNRARYLNTSTGRFWSMDTFEGDDFTPISLHRYLYGQADPMQHTDPSGNVSATETTAALGDSETIDAAADEEDAQAVQALTNFLARTTPVLATGAKAGVVLTLAGAILVGAVAPMYNNPSAANETLLRNGHDTDDYALFAFGTSKNSTRYQDDSGRVIDGPRAPRIYGFTIANDPAQRQDIAIVNGMVGPTEPPTGASSFQYPQNTTLTKDFWGIKKSSIYAMEGLAVIKDGPDAEGGHHTIYPTRHMTPKEYVDKFFKLGGGWILAGRKD